MSFAKSHDSDEKNQDFDFKNQLKIKFFKIN